MSDQNAAQGIEGQGQGQGLYPARTYMAKMGGTILVIYTADRVCFELRLPLRVTAPAS